MATICIHSVGSLGDFNPFLLLAKELLKEGHSVRFATLSIYKDQLESIGVQFCSVRPDLGPIDRDLAEKVMDPYKGFDNVFEVFFVPIRQTYEDLNAVCEGADLLITGSLAYAGLLVHKSRNIPWISLAFQPALFISDYEFPVLPQVPWLRFFLSRSVGAVRIVKKMFRWKIDRKSQAWFSLLSELGISQDTNILFEGPYSPDLQIAAYSPVLSPRQPDWPAHRHHTGFIQPSPKALSLSSELEKFLQNGEPPIVFTLGSAAILMGEAFFDITIEVLRITKARAVLVCGDLVQRVQAKGRDLPQVYVTGPEPYSALFPRARILVHQGGAGTTGEALRAGTPMVVVPFGQDQYDNAWHIEKMGCGVWCPMNSLSVSKLLKLLKQVDQESIREASHKISERLQTENGLAQMVTYVKKMLTQP